MIAKLDVDRIQFVNDIHTAPHNRLVELVYDDAHHPAYIRYETQQDRFRVVVPWHQIARLVSHGDGAL